MDILRKYFSITPDKPLHHYTTLKGFNGIINDGEIWATNIYYMNDQAELNRAIQLLHAELDARIALLREEHLKLRPNASGPQTDPAVINIEAKLRFFEGVKSTVLSKVKEKRIQFYICSFTELDDRLSQWRGYCEDGAGFSIGFDFTEIKANLFLSKCNYDEGQQRQILNELVGQLFYQLEGNIDANIAASKNEVSMFSIGAIISSHFVELCVNSFFNIAPLFKHPKYGEEAEWRIVVGDDKDALSKNIKVVESAQVLKPYLCLKLAWLPKIKQIRVGPSPHIDLNELAAKLFLKSMNMDSEIVLRSEIPYRGAI
jgi:hypothetical protein